VAMRAGLVFPGRPALPFARDFPVMALLSRSCRAVAAFAVALAVTGAGVAGAQPDPYKQHMENGVKLYADRNYAAAVVEFQAAYEAKPGASPLLDIALCDKEMFRYPQAIAVLEEVLRKHGAAMSDRDRKEAEDAIREMRALLATLTLTVTPPDARIFIDDEELPPGAAGRPIPLGPGEHKIGARADGYAPAEQRIKVSSGREQAMAIALVAEKGFVRIEAPDPRMTITVDEQPVGRDGVFAGMLPPGVHVVRMFGPEGTPYAVQIQVVAGTTMDVKKGVGGVPIVPGGKDGPAPVRGFYVLGIGSMLFGVPYPPLFPMPTLDYGAGYGVRAGFQVNKVAGFEATYEHSSIFTYSGADGGASYYRLVSNRFAVGLRLISEGKQFAGDTTLRFVGSFGGGFVDDQMLIYIGPNAIGLCAKPPATCPIFSTSSTADNNHVGVDAFALAELALEVDIDHVLLDFGVEGQLQSTGNLTVVNAASETSIFGSKPLANVGPALRIGYRFW
jgi:hypothetical protein